MNNVKFVDKCHIIAIITECQELINDDKNYDISYSPESKEGAEAAIEYILKRVNDIPTANVLERRGEWKRVSDDDQYEGRYFCSKCKEEFFCAGDYDDLLPNFCPNCGAKMGGSGKSDNWIATSEQLPVENQIVETKIDDENGVRNEQELIYSHNLWFFPDMSMYVYYTPTHWRRSERTGGKDGESDEV